MYQLKLTKRAKNELKNIRKIYATAVNAVLEEIRENPLAGKPLARELTGRYSYKIDVFRIIYRVNRRDEKIFIITAGHRATVYNKD